jgi:hypothetical protein
VPEAARLLRPGGRLHFLVHAFLLTLCVPAEDGSAAGDRLLRPAFGMYRVLNGPRTTALSFISPTVIGSDCCESPDSRSRTWSSFVRKRTRRQRIRMARSSGRATGQAKKYGRPADARRLWVAVTRGKRILLGELIGKGRLAQLRPRPAWCVLTDEWRLAG